MQNPNTFAPVAQLQSAFFPEKNTEEKLYAEYQKLLNKAVRYPVRADGRGKGRQGQLLQQAWNKHAEWKNAVAASKLTFVDSLFQAATCTKCSFPIPQGKARSILGDFQYHLECDPSAWGNY